MIKRICLCQALFAFFVTSHIFPAKPGVAWSILTPWGRWDFLRGR
ncbi:hypothetical protein T09_5695 [Trichinella sp. T9]|nr:hypothetical protein T09_5695 [Trichinella sp. T9]